MGFLEFVPFIMVYTAILVQVKSVEYFGLGILEISVEFLPVDKLVAVGIHITKVHVIGLGIRHSGFVMFAATWTSNDQCNEDDWNNKKKYSFHISPYRVGVNVLSPAQWHGNKNIKLTIIRLYLQSSRENDRTIRGIDSYS